MSYEEITKAVCDAWRHAASELSIRMEIPYSLKTNGDSVLCVAYLPNFGSPKGMVIGLIYGPAYEIDKKLKQAAESQGLFYSFINSEVYDRYDCETFKEALVDWGFFGNDDCRPSWLERPKSGG